MQYEAESLNFHWMKTCFVILTFRIVLISSPMLVQLTVRLIWRPPEKTKYFFLFLVGLFMIPFATCCLYMHASWWRKQILTLRILNLNYFLARLWLMSLYLADEFNKMVATHTEAGKSINYTGYENSLRLNTQNIPNSCDG